MNAVPRSGGTVLELQSVGKTYPSGHRAVDGLNLRLSAGLLGLLGPNGAGKSTLMRIVATVTRPTCGRVLLNGVDVVAQPEVMRRTLGYLPQDFGVYPNLTAREFLAYLAAAKRLPASAARVQVDELLELVNLTDTGKRPLGRFSGGMLRRVGIAQALLGDPQVVVVDEPTAGLDPQERVRFRNLLSDLAADRVVLLSTHIVSDVESVAADLAVLVAGQLRRRGSPQDLLQEVHGQVWEVTVPADQVAATQARWVVSRMVRTGDGVRLRLLSGEPPTAGAELVAPDLEDAYLGLVTERDAAPAGPAASTRAARTGR